MRFVPPEGHRRNKNEREKKKEEEEKGTMPSAVQCSAAEKLSKNWSGSIYATPVWFRPSSSSRDKDTCFSLSLSLKKKKGEERKEEEKRGDVFLKRLV